MGLSSSLLVGFVLAEGLALFPVSFMVTEGVLFSDDMTHSRGNKRVFIIDGTFFVELRTSLGWNKGDKLWAMDGGAGCGGNV